MRLRVLLMIGIGCRHASPAPAPESKPAVVTPAGDRCATDADCVIVVGDPCNPCGPCPYTPATVMSKQKLDALRGAPGCASSVMRLNDMPPPNCSPCENHPEAPRPSRAACVEHVCTAR
jgi:hypothetical protein